MTRAWLYACSFHASPPVAGGGGGGLGRVRLNWYTVGFGAPAIKTSGVSSTGAVVPN